ncbi:MAG: polysaccharide deacetylase family protein, partial [Acidobacteriota bacterium]
SLWRREWSLPDRGPIVSFTFDDFPRSALETGGGILRSYDVCGTYYAAMGLMGQINERGEHFNERDLRHLLADGHELGSHTFNHVSCRSTPPEVFDADALKGREAVISFTGTSRPHEFAYPYGDVTLRAKSRIGSQMNSCRSIIDGVNISPVDLHLLRANSLYHSAFDLGVIKHLFQVNDQRRGWLIFYTHDVRDNPSRWGCKPSQFESVVRLAIQKRAEVLTVGSVLEGLPMNPTANTPEN